MLRVVLVLLSLACLAQGALYGFGQVVSSGSSKSGFVSIDPKSGNASMISSWPSNWAAASSPETWVYDGVVWTFLSVEGPFLFAGFSQENDFSTIARLTPLFTSMEGAIPVSLAPIPDTSKMAVVWQYDQEPAGDYFFGTYDMEVSTAVQVGKNWSHSLFSTEAVNGPLRGAFFDGQLVLPVAGTDSNSDFAAVAVVTVSTGELRVVPVKYQVYSLAVSPDGRLLCTSVLSDSGTPALFQLNPASGEQTLIGKPAGPPTTPGGGGAFSLTIDNGMAYAWTSCDNGFCLLEMDLHEGVTAVRPLQPSTVSTTAWFSL